MPNDFAFRDVPFGAPAEKQVAAAYGTMARNAPASSSC